MVIIIVLISISSTVINKVVISTNLLGGSRSCLVIMHPNLKHLSLHTNLAAKPLNLQVVFSGYSPPEPLRELQHSLLLLRRELRTEPLLPRRRWRRSRRVEVVVVVVAHHHLLVSAGRVRRPNAGRPAAASVGDLHRVDGWAAGSGSGAPAVVDRLPAVEVAVAGAGGALQGLEGPVGARRHELAAAVGDVAAHRRGVVFEALAVRRVVVVVVPVGYGYDQLLGVLLHDS